MHSENSFITLTTSVESVKKYGRSLDVAVFQKFMKRFREELDPDRKLKIGPRRPRKKIRFFHCGEYTQSFLPHYHALIFGYGFPDRKYWCMNKSGTHKLYRSDMLERLWPFGHSYIGDVSFESAAYVARYVMKKVVVTRDDQDRLIMKDTGELLSREYVTMSRRPGIGATWYEKFKSDVYPYGDRVVRGRKMRPPKFYDKRYSDDDPVGFEELQFIRQNKLDKLDNTELRLLVKEKVANSRLKLFPRE